MHTLRPQRTDGQAFVTKKHGLRGGPAAGQRVTLTARVEMLLREELDLVSARRQRMLAEQGVLTRAFELLNVWSQQLRTDRLWHITRLSTMGAALKGLACLPEQPCCAVSRGEAFRILRPPLGSPPHSGGVAARRPLKQGLGTVRPRGGARR